MPQQLDCTSYIRRQVGNAEILHGLPMNNEYELIPFNHFTFSRVYPIDLSLGKRVVEKPIGYKRKDLLDALNRGLESLNKNETTMNGRYTLDDFIEGIYRTEPVRQAAALLDDKSNLEFNFNPPGHRYSI